MGRKFNVDGGYNTISEATIPLFSWIM